MDDGLYLGSADFDLKLFMTHFDEDVCSTGSLMHPCFQNVLFVHTALWWDHICASGLPYSSDVPVDVCATCHRVESPSRVWDCILSSVYPAFNALLNHTSCYLLQISRLYLVVFSTSPFSQCFYWSVQYQCYSQHHIKILLHLVSRIHCCWCELQCQYREIACFALFVRVWCQRGLWGDIDWGFACNLFWSELLIRVLTVLNSVVHSTLCSWGFFLETTWQLLCCAAGLAIKLLHLGATLQVPSR